jgi:hypothetical protein
MLLHRSSSGAAALSLLPRIEAGAELCKIYLMHMHQGQIIFLVVLMS